MIFQLKPKIFTKIAGFLLKLDVKISNIFPETQPNFRLKDMERSRNDETGGQDSVCVKSD